LQGADTSGFADAVRAARASDAVVLVVGEDREMSGEAHSRASLDLPGNQEELAWRLAKTGKPIVAVLMNGRPLSTAWLDGHVPAIIESRRADGSGGGGGGLRRRQPRGATPAQRPP